MNIKWHMFLWLLMISALLGASATGFVGYKEGVTGAELLNAYFFHIFSICSILTFTAILPLSLLAQLTHDVWLGNRQMLRHDLKIAGILLAVIALFYAEEDWRGRHAWEKFKQEWEAKDEKFDFASFIPPPVPDDQNFALTSVVAGCYSRYLDKDGHRKAHEDTNAVNRLEMWIYPNYDFENAPTNGDWERGQLTNLKAWQTYYRSPLYPLEKYQKPNEFPIATKPQSPAEDVVLALSKFDAPMEDVRRAALLPYSRFPLEYDLKQPLSPPLFHVSALVNCISILKLRASAELELGLKGRALEDVKLALRLADSMHSEPFLISQLIRIRLLWDTLQPIFDGLAKHQWSDANLAELNVDLKKLDLLTDMQFALRGERAAMLATVEDFRSARDYRTYAGYPPQFFEWNLGTVSGAAAFHLIPDGWFYQLELRIAQTNQLRRVRLVDATSRLAFPQKEIEIDEINHVVRPWPLFMANGMYFLDENPERRIIHMQENVDMARVACALERYRMAIGEYPETLKALSPRFIETVPHDIIGGQPLHYHRADNGSFVLYSIGWNEKDDGGVPSRSETDTQLNWSDGDWVWPSPAK